MNERVRALADEATTTEYGVDNGFDRVTFDKEKFAELIVNECMNQVREQYLPVLEDEHMMKDTHWAHYVQCGVDSYVAIKLHFFGEEE